MKKITIRSVTQQLLWLVLFLGLTGIAALPAQAHEFRDLGNNYATITGWNVEPAVENSPNGIDVFLAFDTTGNGDFSDLDASLGDTKVLAVVPIRLKTDSFNAKIIQIFPVLTQFQEVPGEDGLNNLFSFTPNQDGAWGWFLAGFIQKVGQSPKLFAKKFVCGNGSQDLPNSQFDCVDPAP